MQETFVGRLRGACAVLPGSHVLVAVSGGADSTALLCFFCEIRETYPISVSCAHVEHGIRGAASEEDMRFVKALCEFLVENGRRPMFWGDIICGFPEMIKELPKETICLNWGYAKYQREDETRWLSDAGAVQYSCPGACGWNQFVYLIENSYENIRRMCSYAAKYHSIGVLNTDWGDFLHVNHPELGIVGMIYGAAFSWNGKIPAFEEINRQISRLEFGDEKEQFVGIAASAAGESAFAWETAIRFKELGEVPEFTEDHKAYIAEHLGEMEDVDGKNRRLSEISRKLYGCIVHMEAGKAKLVKPYLVAVDAIRLFNELGKVVTSRNYGLSYYAAFPGCSSETEPSAATIAFLTDEVEEEQIPVVFRLELSNGKVAEAIAEVTGTETAMLHSCHTLTREEMERGETYLSLMRQNLVQLDKALNG